MNIRIEKTTQPKSKPDEDSLGFGKYFTDHMFLMDYSMDKGWYDPRIVPFQRLPMHPAATIFHYGAQVFEGLKAYRTPDNHIQMFRPIENIRRMNNSAERLCLPQIDEDDYMQALKALVEIDADWVPHKPGTSLYIRPFTIGTDEYIGLHTYDHVTFIIIASPVGNYYKEGMNPVSIIIETRDVRAVRGGTGFAKCGGNYAAATRACMVAESKGYTQVLWLDGVERRYIEEAGSMNVMFKIDGEIVTPALTGSVLPGVTRKSFIELMRDTGRQVTERLISVEELRDALEAGKVEEAWGCGTAAVISPIGKLVFGDDEYVVNNNEIGPIVHELYDTLTGIQWGRLPDPHGWTVRVC